MSDSKQPKAPPASAAQSDHGERPKSERGASATEYGLLITGIAALVALIVFSFGDNVGDLFDGTCDSIAAQGAGTAC